MKPVVIDLCCCLGGWTRGFMSEGWDAIGFDIERHEYGDKRYPGELILKSILDVNGYDLRAANPSLVVASPPCQAYSYMAMPWSRAKREVRWQQWERDSPFGDRLAKLRALFDACFRIARELGVPIVLENVKGAQPWVGRANAHFGSYYLWGDVGNVGGRVVRADRTPRFGESLRVGGRRMKANPDGTEHGQGSWLAIADSKNRGAAQKGRLHGWTGGDWESDGIKAGGDWFGNYAEMKAAGTISPGRLHSSRPSAGATECLASLQAQRDEQGGMKGTGGGWFEKPYRERGVNSKSPARKAASAMIAEIPFDLAQYIARVFKPATSGPCI